MQGFRKERVASVVREIVSEALVHRLSDPRLEPMTTVTRVEVSADLLIAKVYVIVPGNESTEKRTMGALHNARGYVQRMVASALRIRHCPELRFLVDEGMKEAKHTFQLLDEIYFQMEGNGRDGEESPKVEGPEVEVNGYVLPESDAPQYDLLQNDLFPEDPEESNGSQG